MDKKLSSKNRLIIGIIFILIVFVGIMNYPSFKLEFLPDRKYDDILGKAGQEILNNLTFYSQNEDLTFQKKKLKTLFLLEEGLM